MEKYTEPNTKRNVFINIDAIVPFTKETKADGTYSYRISPLTAKIHNELLKRFQANGFGTLTLSLKNGWKINVIPYPYKNAETKCLKTMQWFTITDAPHEGMGSESLTEIAGMIADFDRHIAIAIEDENRLREFYETRIQGHEDRELRIGNTLLHEFERFGMTPNNFDECWAMDAFMIGYEELADAIRLALDFQTYCGRYKSIYGESPKLTTIAA